MKKKAIKILSIVSMISGLFLAAAWPFFELTVVCKKDRKQSGKKWFELSHTKVNHPRHKFADAYEEGKAWCRSQEMKDCYIKSVDGLWLHASYLPAKKAERFVLLSHGYRGSGFGDFAYIAKFLHEHHCSLLFIDQRCCGESEGSYITFGAKERYDVQKWTYYLDGLNQERLPVYLYGESMGAASVLMASGLVLPDSVRGMIADCGFCSMKGQIQDIAANWFHLKWIGFLLLRLDLFCRICAGFCMKDADTIKALEKNKRPILFFHGMEDTYVNPKNTIYHYYKCQSPKELLLVEGARHLCSAYAAPERYRKKIIEFFEKYDYAF